MGRLVLDVRRCVEGIGHQLTHCAHLHSTYLAFATKRRTPINPALVCMATTTFPGCIPPHPWLLFTPAGNDFSTLYAPLIRDGRMEKFYWDPDREDVINIVWQVG